MDRYLDEIGRAKPTETVPYPMEDEPGEAAPVSEPESAAEDPEGDPPDDVEDVRPAEGDDSEELIDVPEVPDEEPSGAADVAPVLPDWTDDDELQSVTPDLESPRDDEQPRAPDLPGSSAFEQAGRPQYQGPAAFAQHGHDPLSSQRSPLEAMTAQFLGHDPYNPQQDFRKQFSDVLQPAIEQMQVDMYSGLNEAIADVQNGMERRHLI